MTWIMVEAKTDAICREQVRKIADVLRAKGHVKEA